MSGGGLSTGYERTEGLGVDQILELELVLPDGSHVKVYPSDWDVVQGHIYPQTSKVTAMCNANVVADESQWEWEPCDSLNVAPEDIWLSVRGGGGGTYAVTLSVTYQLFEQHPVRVMYGGATALELAAKYGDEGAKETLATIDAKFKADKSGTMWEEARRTYTLFLVDFMFAPGKIGISDDASIHCGSPALNYQTTSIASINCVSKNSFWPEISSAWNQTVHGTKLAARDPELANLLSKYLISDGESAGIGPFSGWADLMKKELGDHQNNIYPPGVVPDSPLPSPVPDRKIGTYCSINLPLGLLQSDDEDERELVFKVLDVAGGEHVTGGNVAKASDGMTAVPPSERISGQSSVYFQSAIDHYGDDILSDVLSAVYKYASDPHGTFPGFSEYNHLCADAKTPSKADWTKDCSEEDEEECFSVQESIWGETLYAKLQGIKAAVDPDYLFDCYQCVKPSSSKITVGEQ